MQASDTYQRFNSLTHPLFITDFLLQGMPVLAL
ncbi:hypothetical protein SAMN05216262_102217 [Colwellia chukchiensis]|uniref:Uncharacterized protein n=1 Tax=Colwellia chukchiensis TaxID=641665 RepID=A0A1H7JGS3_9GAMM|nr:hypothetical protein SAMN05216262_102217 [Colwellia chukchiensis]